MTTKLTTVHQIRAQDIDTADVIRVPSEDRWSHVYEAVQPGRGDEPDDEDMLKITCNLDERYVLLRLSNDPQVRGLRTGIDDPLFTPGEFQDRYILAHQFDLFDVQVTTRLEQA